MARRITSKTKGYKDGHLSVFPAALDSKLTLFEAVNNAETTLKHGLTVLAKYILVEDASSFPENGILKITSEMGESETIFYGKKIGNQFHLLNRGVDSTKHGPWDAGCRVTCPVMADHHNALKDAIIKIQKKVGLNNNPDVDSLSGELRVLEQRWLSPKTNFQSYPQDGNAPLTVRFQNFSSGHALKFLWDFGDGTTSVDKNPTHTYLEEGNYTVRLNAVSNIGSKSFSEKPNYIEVNNKKRIPFFYAKPLQGTSLKTSNKATEFCYIDQSSGDIIERHWFFGDGQDYLTSDPNEHTVKHVYANAGDYNPVLVLRYKDNVLSRANIFEGITVT